MIQIPEKSLFSVLKIQKNAKASRCLFSFVKNWENPYFRSCRPRKVFIFVFKKTKLIKKHWFLIFWIRNRFLRYLFVICFKSPLFQSQLGTKSFDLSEKIKIGWKFLDFSFGRNRFWGYFFIVFFNNPSSTVGLLESRLPPGTHFRGD